MNNNIKNFLEIVNNNPNLPVVCAVDSDVVCGDDYGRWIAQIGYCKVGEFTLYNDRWYQDREEFKEDYYCYNDDVLDERFNYKSILYNENLSEAEMAVHKESKERLEAYLNEVAEKAFHEAIIVNIDLPDDITEFTEKE